MENQELSVEETEAFLQTVNKLLEEFRKIKSSQENSDHLVQLLDKLDEYLTVVTAFCLRREFPAVSYSRRQEAR